MPDLDTIGKRFEYAMNVAGLKRGDLAVQMDTHYESIGKWIRGNSIPSQADHQRNFEKATGFSIRWVQTGEGDMRIKSASQASEPYDPLHDYPYPDKLPKNPGPMGPATYEIKGDGIKKAVVMTSDVIDRMNKKRITTFVVTEVRDWEEE